MTSARTLFPPLALGLAVALAGCEAEPIRTASVPRQEEDVSSGKVRLLAAIVPVGDETWFFKMVGRSDIVGLTEPDFKKVIDSLDFPKQGDKVTWVAPKGWKEDREVKKGMAGERKGTLKPEGAPGPILTIDVLRGPGAAAVKPNVDRWRRVDLGLGPSTGRTLDRIITPKTIKGQPITLVDMSGPGAEAKAPAMPGGHPPIDRPGGGAAPEAGKGMPGLNYQLPAGWRVVSTTAMPSATIDAGGGQLKITRLRGDMPGGFKSNLDRWRGEVGLGASTAKDLADARPQMIRVGGGEGRLLEIKGRALTSRVVWVNRGGSTWFIKLAGPSEAIAREQANFDRFIQSLQFTGAGE